LILNLATCGHASDLTSIEALTQAGANDGAALRNHTDGSPSTTGTQYAGIRNPQGFGFDPSLPSVGWAAWAGSQ
jgi:hypothetical protein